MHLQGVPIVMISAWLGHADPAFTMRTYMHTQDDAMKAAAASLQRVVTPRDTEPTDRTWIRRALWVSCAGQDGLLIEPPVRIELTTARLQGD